jgi:hypothetical protein
MSARPQVSRGHTLQTSRREDLVQNVVQEGGEWYGEKSIPSGVVKYRVP